jgi:methionyl-tRNA formyltransferase
MGSDVRIAFLTADDPLYLPAFFEMVLDEFASQTEAVFIAPPLYKGQSTRQAGWRYYRTFGLGAAAGLGTRVLAAKARRRCISAVCRTRGVACSSVDDVNAQEFLERLRRANVDVIVSVSCPQIFKKELIELPARGCLNVHGSLLPQYRGVMPSFWMLANGDRQAGVSVYFVNEAIDAGDLCGQRSFEIDSEDTLDRFLRRSKRIAAELLIDVLRRLEEGTLSRTPLDLSRGSYYSWPDPESVLRFRAAGRRLW